MYAVLGMGESALVHAARSLALCMDNAIGGFDLAFGYEAVARAYSVLGNVLKTQEHKAAALAACEQIADGDDRVYAQGEISSIG